MSDLPGWSEAAHFRLIGAACGVLFWGLASTAMAFEPLIQVSVSNPPRPMISGTTNLPDGTPLLVTVSMPRDDSMRPGHVIYPVMGQSAVDVQSGYFIAGPFSNDGSLYDRGTYIVSVVISTLALPDSVKPILGETREKLDGPNVKEGPHGPWFELRTSFEVK